MLPTPNKEIFFTNINKIGSCRETDKLLYTSMACQIQIGQRANSRDNETLTEFLKSIVSGIIYHLILNQKVI